MNGKDTKSLERAFTACLRFIYGLRRYDSTRDYKKKVFGCSFLPYFKYRRCIVMHDIVNKRVPRFLTDKLTLSRSSRTNMLIIPKHYTKQYGRSFFVLAATDYNELPVVARSRESRAAFGKACLEYLSLKG